MLAQKRLFLLSIYALLFNIACDHKNGPPKKITFEVTYEVDREKMEVWKDSVINTLKGDGNDANRKMIEDGFKDLLEKENEESEIIITINKDSIWNNTVINGKEESLFKRIGHNGNVYYHDDQDKTLAVDSVNYYKRYSDSGVYEIKEYIKDTKVIKGYNCHKVSFRYIPKENQNNPIVFGPVRYEMYVTAEINLPIYAVLPFYKEMKQMFPLEILKYEERAPGIIELYKVTSIKDH